MVFSGRCKGGVGARSSPFPFSWNKHYYISAEHHLKEAYEQGIGLKMQKMAILETQVFKNFWGSMPPDPPK